MRIHPKGFITRANTTALHFLLDFLESKCPDKFILDFFAIPTNMEKIAIASESLHNSLIEILTGSLDETKRQKTILTLVKYFLRMTVRPTPFGLFSSCLYTEYQSTPFHKIIINSIKRKTRPSTENYLAILDQMLILPEIKKNLKFSLNTSIYKVGQELRYIEYIYRNNFRSYQVSSIRASRYLTAIIRFLETEKTFEELVSKVEELNFSKDDAISFINDLIKNQILTHSLEPALTRGDHISYLHAFIEKTFEGSELLDQQVVLKKASYQLKEIANSILKLDTKINTKQDYEEITTLFSNLVPPDRLSRNFQIDVTGDATAISTPENGTMLNLSDLPEATHVLSMLSSPESSDIDNFQREFTNKYEMQEIPLMIALDHEIGIGYPVMKENRNLSPFLGDVHIPLASVQTLTLSQKWIVLAKLLVDAKHGSKKNIQLHNNAIFEQLKIQKEKLPSISTTVMVELLYEGNETFPVILACGGSSGVNLLARFCHAEEKIAILANDIAKNECFHGPNVVVAEVIHNPQDKDSVLLRPSLYEYDIPFMGKSTKPKDKQIVLEDLMISVSGGQIILKSKRLNKIVIPRITSAHNYSNPRNLSLYRFLGEIQNTKSDKIHPFHWGPLTALFKHFPRIYYKRVILAPACWVFESSDYTFVKKLDKANSKAIELEVKKWREDWSIPRYVAIVQGDNELFIDFEHTFCRLVFIDVLKDTSSIKLIEKSTEFGHSIVVDSSNNKYSAQFIINFINTEHQTGSNKMFISSAVSKKHNLIRKFIPGDSWVYYKIYLGPKFSDEFLVTVFKNFSNGMNYKKRDWFFIRYGDPNYHLRIRFRILGDNINELFHQFSALVRPYINSGHINTISIDSYNREIERYGAKTISLCENLFCLESAYVSSILPMLNHSEDLRWKVAMITIDNILDIFGYNHSTKAQLMKLMSANFGKEFGKETDKNLKLSLAQKYRTLKLDITNLLDRKVVLPKEIQMPLKSYLKEYNIIACQIVKLEKTRLPLLLESFLHMFINRLFITEQRGMEMVLYDFLSNYYQSRLARNY